MATVDDDDDVGGAVRSPKYPSISLRTAVEKVAAIYKADKTAGSPLQAVWGLIGYKSKSGPATMALAALKRFGLVEVRSGRVFPTDRAIAIVCLPADDARRKVGLQSAVQAPTLYNELLHRYSKSGLPSAESLKHELMLDKRFNHNAIPALIADFLDSLQYAGLTDDKGVLLAASKDGKSSAGDSGEFDDDDEGDPQNDDVPSRKKRKPMAAGSKEDVFTLDEGDVVLQWPARISKISAQDLEDWLALIVRKAKRQAEADEANGGQQTGSAGRPPRQIDMS